MHFYLLIHPSFPTVYNNSYNYNNYNSGGYPGQRQGQQNWNYQNGNVPQQRPPQQQQQQGWNYQNGGQGQHQLPPPPQQRQPQQQQQGWNYQNGNPGQHQLPPPPPQQRQPQQQQQQQQQQGWNYQNGGQFNQYGNQNGGQFNQFNNQNPQYNQYNNQNGGQYNNQNGGQYNNQNGGQNGQFNQYGNQTGGQNVQYGNQTGGQYGNQNPGQNGQFNQYGNQNSGQWPGNPQPQQTSQSSPWSAKPTQKVIVQVHIVQNDSSRDSKMLNDGSQLYILKEKLCIKDNLNPNDFEFVDQISNTQLDEGQSLPTNLKELWLIRKDMIGFGSQQSGQARKIIKVLVELKNSKTESTGLFYEDTDTVGSIIDAYSAKKETDCSIYQPYTPNGDLLSRDTPLVNLRVLEIVLKRIQRAAELAPKESVLIICNGYPSMRFSLKQPPLKILAAYLNSIRVENIAVEQVAQFQGMLVQKYWMGIKEIGFVFPLENQDSTTKYLNLYQFVQTMILNGINLVLEVGPANTRPNQEFNEERLSNFLVSEASINDLIAPSFAMLLAQCKEEINESRSLFARNALFLEKEEALKYSPKPNEDPNIALWKKYFAEEMEYVYMNQEPPLPDGTQITLSVKLPSQGSLAFKCSSSTFVKEVIVQIFDKWTRSDQTAGMYRMDDFVLKAAGLSEFIIPTDNELNYLTIGAFDYVRLQHRRNTVIPVVLYDRSFLHSASKRDSEEQFSASSVVLSKLLARDVWRTKNDISSIIKFTDVERLFKVKLSGISFPNISDLNQKCFIYVSARLFFGGVIICDPVFTSALSVKTLASTKYPPQWDGFLSFNIPTKNIPKETRICFTVYSTFEFGENIRPTKVGDKDIPLGWVGIHLLDNFQQLRAGEMLLKLWDGAENPIGTVTDNTISSNPIALAIEFESNTKIVEFPSPEEFDAIPNTSVPFPLKKIDPKDSKSFIDAINKDSLSHLTPTEMKILWSYREIIRDTKPHHISKVLKSCDWSNPDCVREIHRLLKTWPDVNDTQCALELLDAKYADEQVRAFAVSNIENFSDAEVSSFLLQLVQVLKYEPHHASPIAFFIIKRALHNNNQIGHMLYWLLRSEMHDITISERYGVILEAYLRQSKGHRTEIKKQSSLLDSLEKVALKIKEIPAEKRIDVMREGLQKIVFPDSVTLPLDPRFCVCGLEIAKCKYMDSKKLPLWLVFKNVEPDAAPIFIIFKCGDDLRQDILTLQLIRFMDNLWKNNGLDLMLEPYKVVATGNQVGMVEVVLNSETTGKIMKEAGGTFGAIKDDCITNFLKEACRTEPAFRKAQEVFMKSCAGYCVATYILGIGDRHSDNIMVKRTGTFFHIDFGHFLGNFKTKLGVKRERAPFKFTSQFAHVMGGKGSELYNKFEEICCRCYAIVRQPRVANLLITLFSLMLSTGIPELTKEEDIIYLRKVFSFEFDNLQADEKFRKLIKESLESKTTTVNDIIHAAAH